MERPARTPSTKHLLTAEQREHLNDGSPRSITRSRGEGNGVRVHGAYILGVSVLGLLVFIVIIAVASGHMMM